MSPTLDLLHAGLGPWRTVAFLGLHGVDLASAEVVVDGWTKLVVLDGGRAFLFPRRSEDAEALEREAAMLEWLGTQGFQLAPKVLARHGPSQVWPYAYLEVTRMPGVSPVVLAGATDAAVEVFFGSLGAALGSLHRIHPTDAPTPEQSWSTEVSVLARDVAPAFDTSDATVARWSAHLSPVLALENVIVHGELGDHQLLVDPGTYEVTAILDWDTAIVGPPLVDFAFDRWSPWIFQRQDALNARRGALWSGYMSTRRIVLPNAAAVSLLLAIADVRWHLANADRDDHGTLDGAVAVLREADAAAQ